MKIKTKIISFILLGAVSTSVIFSVILFQTEKQVLMQGADEKLLTAVTIIKAMLPADLLLSRGYTGAYLGLYASGNGQDDAGHADFDWVRYEAFPRP